MSTQKLGYFGHHTDTAIDFEVEVDALIGMHVDVEAGLTDKAAFLERLNKAALFAAPPGNARDMLARFFAEHQDLFSQSTAQNEQSKYGISNRYPVAPAQRAHLENEFSYHRPLEHQLPRYEALRSEAKELAIIITGLVPPGQHRETALTRLREAIMWANAGIACGE